MIKLSGGLPFTIVGVFKESVDTFGQSDIQEDTMLIPYTVSRFFVPTAAVYQIYFSVATAQDVLPATDAIKKVLQSRHRPESVYSVQNLTQLLTVAGRVVMAQCQAAAQSVRSAEMDRVREAPTATRAPARL